MEFLFESRYCFVFVFYIIISIYIYILRESKTNPYEDRLIYKNKY
jgi:hypothetical protein